MSEYFEFVAAVGPPWKASTDAAFYNWSALNYGTASNLSANTTLTSTLSASATTANVVSTTNFSTKGGAWIGPGTTGQGWEYVDHTGISATTLTGLTRDSDNREHTGIHNSGAGVWFWYPLAYNNGNLSVSWRMNDKQNTSFWDASLSGVRAPKNVLRPNHVIVIQRKLTPAASYTNFLVGWIGEVNILDTYQYDALWDIQIVSSASMINRSKAPIFNIGAINLGQSGTVNASTTLAAAWKERGTGDYVAAYPSFSGGNAADEDADSLWISDRYVGTEAAHYTVSTIDPMVDFSSAKAIISHVHIALNTGQPDGYRYLEIEARGAIDWVLRTFWVTTETLADAFPVHLYAPELALGQKVILCENEDRFREENPSASPTVLIDLRNTPYPNLLKNRSLAGGAFALYSASSLSENWLHSVAWGTGTRATIESAFTGSIVQIYSPTWGTALSVSTVGETMRYNWANSATAVSNWTVTQYHTPGYDIIGNKEWLLAELPGMDLSLKTAITSGLTGNVTLTKPGGDSNAGILRSGTTTIQIADEQMTCTVTNATQINITARGQNGTAAAAHSAGDPVYVVDGGVATDAYLIRQIKWTRAGGTIYPKDFKIYTANITNPRTPIDSGYTADFSLVATLTAQTASTYASGAIAKRTRNLLFECTLMTTNPARCRLNSLQAIVQELAFDSGSWITTGNAADLVSGILSSVGFPTGGVSTSYSGTNFDKNTTASEFAWNVITDLADYAQLLVSVGLDSKITIEDNHFWTTSGSAGSFYTPAVTWDRANTTQPNFFSSPGDPISQVELNWRAADSSVSGTALYPATPSGTGEVLTLNDYICANSTLAGVVALNRYLRAKYPWSATIEPSTFAVYTPGLYHLVAWDYDPTVPGTDRLVFITDTQINISNRVPKTTISGIEVERYTAQQ